LHLLEKLRDMAIVLWLRVVQVQQLLDESKLRRVSSELILL
jgi:hypothetical protein